MRHDSGKIIYDLHCRARRKRSQSGIVPKGPRFQTNRSKPSECVSRTDDSATAMLGVRFEAVLASHVTCARHALNRLMGHVSCYAKNGTL